MQKHKINALETTLEPCDQREDGAGAPDPHNNQDRLKARSALALPVALLKLT